MITRLKIFPLHSQAINMFPVSLIGDEQHNKKTCNPTSPGLSAAAIAGISIACVIVVVLIAIGIYLVRNRFFDHI